MYIWILEEQIKEIADPKENIIKFGEKQGMKCRFRLFSCPSDMKKEFWRTEDRPAVIFLNPEVKDESMTGLEHGQYRKLSEHIMG